MSKRQNNVRKRSRRRGPVDAATPTRRRSRITAGRKEAPPPAGIAWFRDKRPIFRFVVVFGMLFVPFNVLHYGYFSKSAVFESYLDLNAQVSGAIMRALGTGVTVGGNSISAEGFSLSVALGCDAIQPWALLLCAVLAFPVSPRRKLLGILAGTAALLVLNLVRIVTLFYTGIHFRDLFEMMHIDVWQALFIFLAILLWSVWAYWAGHARALDVDVQTD